MRFSAGVCCLMPASLWFFFQESLEKLLELRDVFQFFRTSGRRFRIRGCQRRGPVELIQRAARVMRAANPATAHQVPEDGCGRWLPVRLDRRLAARVDPSDVVQEAVCGDCPAYAGVPAYPPHVALSLAAAHHLGTTDAPARASSGGPGSGHHCVEAATGMRAFRCLGDACWPDGWPPSRPVQQALDPATRCRRGSGRHWSN